MNGEYGSRCAVLWFAKPTEGDSVKVCGDVEKVTEGEEVAAYGMVVTGGALVIDNGS